VISGVILTMCKRQLTMTLKLTGYTTGLSVVAAICLGYISGKKSGGEQIEHNEGVDEAKKGEVKPKTE
jgi:hypothetical protein